MSWLDRISLFQPLDLLAFAVLLGGWLIVGWRIDSPGKRASVSCLMAEYRREWMIQMVSRDPRIFDSQVIAMLRQGTAFFASACMIAIGGVFAVMGNAERVVNLANDLTLSDDPAIVWELKLAVVLILLANAFLKFVWASRLFSYCAVLVAAVPNDASDPRAYPRAAQAAEINITAARSFNRGLRAIYFALAAATWVFGPLVLLIASVATIAILWRREFASKSREALISGLQIKGET
ncbi:DUF599 domain-containing protein [Primorskyibacter sp. S187A]|uniref:DUF599 domain-containing protein n=1 Tax=Primorskyibacter sp. S187A TaxID=3415130 RepID=UPI003C7C5BAA